MDLTLILTASPGDLSRLPLDHVNLLCAAGLPDTDGLSIHSCLRTIVGWAEHVRSETERNFARFRRDPEQYCHSEAFYRVLMMVTVPQEDCRVRYDPDCIKSSRFLDSGEAFYMGCCSARGREPAPRGSRFRHRTYRAGNWSQRAKRRLFEQLRVGPLCGRPLHCGSG